MSDCAEAQELLHLLLDGELAGPQRGRLEAHLSSCPSCRRDYQELETTRRLLRESPIPEPPAQFWERVSSHWLEELKARLPPPAITLRFALLFALLLALFAIWWCTQGAQFWLAWLER